MAKILKILVIDDDEVDRMTVGRGLKKVGIQTDLTEAINCAQAYAILQKNTFDSVFLDYRLPDGDGLSLIKKLRSLGIKTPLIVLTGQGDEEIAVELMKAGASDYLSKSRISPETLEQTLRNAIRVYQAEKEIDLANQKLRESNELLTQQNRELEKQRQQIELQNEKLQELSQLKSQFLANMSHELRTPLNAIMGFSQLLLRQYPDPLSEQQVNIVKRIFNNSQNLLLMLNEVLDFSKIEAGHLELHLSEFDLGALVILTVEELRSLAIEKNLSLKVNINLKNPFFVGDRVCLRRILVNLISNAIKFTDTGEVVVEIQDTTPEKVELAVKDTGCGIAKENQKEIFEAFRQVDQTITRRHSGTGLGLAITDSLVKMMQGNIIVESEVGKGSIFRVQLPRQSA